MLKSVNSFYSLVPSFGQSYKNRGCCDKDKKQKGGIFGLYIGNRGRIE